MCPQKATDEGCNSECMKNFSSKCTMKVQAYYAYSFLFTVWELILHGCHSKH